MYINGSEIEKADPFTVFALIHLINFQGKAHQHHLSIAVSLARYLGLESDRVVYWMSPNGAILGNEESGIGRMFCRSLWLYLYLTEFYSSVAAGLPFIISFEFKREIVDLYKPCNEGDPSHLAIK